MRIAYISADFGVPIFGFKGASVHVREMVAAFCRNGHSVTIMSPAMIYDDNNWTHFFHDNTIALPPDIGLYPILPDEQHVHLIQEFEKLDKFLQQKTRIRQEVRNLFYNLTLYESGLNYLKERSVDFIYERYALFSYAGIRMSRELGIPHILEVNAPLAYEQEKMRGLEMKDFARALEGRIFRDTDKVIVVSRNLRDFVASCNVPDEKIAVIPNSVDPVRFEAALGNGEWVRHKYNLAKTCVIGFVGSLKPWHGTETLLEAFFRLRSQGRQAHLLIVGDGPMKNELEGYCQKQGLEASVTFTGKIPYNEIPRYIAAMDITVAPYTANENFYYSPIKIFEYMIMAKPVVAGKIGQVEEMIIDGKNGRLFEPGNVKALSEVLRELVDHPGIRKEIGEKAQIKVRKERTWDNNAREVLEIAQEFLKHEEGVKIHGKKS